MSSMEKNAIFFDEPIDTVILDSLKKFEPIIGRTANYTEYFKIKNENCVYRKDGRVNQNVWVKFNCADIGCRNSANGTYNAAMDKYELNLNGSHPSVLAAMAIEIAKISTHTSNGVIDFGEHRFNKSPNSDVRRCMKKHNGESCHKKALLLDFQKQEFLVIIIIVIISDFGIKQLWTCDEIQTCFDTSGTI